MIKKDLNKIGESSFFLNFTGETNLMALAAYETLAGKEKNINCNTEHKHILFLFPEYKIEELNAKLSIKDFFL